MVSKQLDVPEVLIPPPKVLGFERQLSVVGYMANKDWPICHSSLQMEKLYLPCASKDKQTFLILFLVILFYIFFVCFSSLLLPLVFQDCVCVFDTASKMVVCHCLPSCKEGFLHLSLDW